MQKKSLSSMGIGYLQYLSIRRQHASLLMRKAENFPGRMYYQQIVKTKSEKKNKYEEKCKRKTSTCWILEYRNSKFLSTCGMLYVESKSHQRSRGKRHGGNLPSPREQGNFCVDIVSAVMVALFQSLVMTKTVPELPTSWLI